MRKNNDKMTNKMQIEFYLEIEHKSPLFVETLKLKMNC